MKIENKILPNEEQIKGFTDEPEKGPIRMLNLVKLKNQKITSLKKVVVVVKEV